MKVSASTVAPARPATTLGGVGTSAIRPDAVPKTKGQFAYSSDLWAEGMLWARR